MDLETGWRLVRLR